MKKEKPSKYESLLYALIVLSCLIAVWMFLSADLSPDRSTFEMYFKNYPSQISEGQNLSFSILLKVNNSDNPLTITVYFDDVNQKEMEIVNPCCATIESGFSLENEFKKGEEHTVSVKLFDESKSYYQLGSNSLPYYIFFKVKVV